MTVADVTSRISSIQGQIAMLTQPTGNAAAFASAMALQLGWRPPPPPQPPQPPA